MTHVVLRNLWYTFSPPIRYSLTDLTQERFPALEALLCWEYFVGSHVMEHLASLAEWQRTMGSEGAIDLSLKDAYCPPQGWKEKSLRN